MQEWASGASLTGALAEEFTGNVFCVCNTTGKIVSLAQWDSKGRERHWSRERKRTFVAGIRRAASHVKVGGIAGVAILKA